MDFPLPSNYKHAILRQYDINISRYPVIRSEVDAFLQGKEETFSLCMKYLYGHMAAQDILSVSVDIFADYVQATLDAFRQIDYLKAVPPEIFFPYVLYHRVNSEHLDGSRSLLLAQLMPYAQGKSMEQAALNVNYWCYAHATYAPADDRTLGVMGILRRTLGRCGEESVLAVAALRSVGIPARQCYCPRWSHCDDNHAWVEVWIDGTWRYLGACEPEEALDRGWFTAAASRAMLVDTKCWADWEHDALYKPVHCTARYTNTKTLTVRVTADGLPVPEARVRFQIVNYSELFTLWETSTDRYGNARFETGHGDLFIFAQHGEKVALVKADLRWQGFITVELKATFPAYVAADVVPPDECRSAAPCAESPHHRILLSLCEAHLADRRAAFTGQSEYLRHAAGNAPEIQNFLEDSPYPLPLKEELLSALRPKDFADVTKETLEDALEAAMPARGQYPEDIFRACILSPRVADEMLLPERQQIRRLFPNGFSDPQQILDWMRAHMQTLPDEGINHYYPSPLGCLRCRQVPAFAFDMVFVALCRAFSFPARLQPHTGSAQWLDTQGLWRDIYPAMPTVKLTVEIPAEKKLNYSEHFTLGLWNGADFDTLKYSDLTLERSHVFCLQPGLYRITVTTRQIDGTASVAIWHQALSDDTTLSITLPEDQTPQRLKQIPLNLPATPVRQLLQHNPGRNLLLIFAEPGSEPTEHLLTEMLDRAADFRDLSCRILLLAEKKEALGNPTVLRLKAALPQGEFLYLQDPDGLAALHRQMQVGDLRLPFVVCLDRHGRGVYADANYRIRMAQTLLEILKILENKI